MTGPVEAFKRAIVRIQDARDGQVCGLGLLVAPHWILSCAHVVAAAVRGNPDAMQAPSGELLLDLPFVSGARVVTRVSGNGVWYPRNSLDLALLHLDVPLAQEGYTHISPALSLFGIHFEGWGAPDGHQQHLIPIRGRLEREISNGRYLANVQSSNYKIREGCSGAPLVDSATGLVLGLVVQEELEADAHAGFAIPASHLRRVLREAGLGLPAAEERELGILIPWVKTRYGARFRLRNEVVRFIDHYRSKADEPRPFAGRTAVLRFLDQWQAQRTDRLLLISGPAGRGKSALLLHWMAQQLRQNSGLVLCYLPISIRFGTADALTGVQLLFASLCDVFSDLQDNLPNPPQVEDYLDRIAAAWRHIESRADQSFLLVVDGLDEAVGHWFLKQRVLPPELPANLHVLISARHKPGHEDGLAWLKELDALRLGGRTLSSDIGASRLLEIPALDRAAMAEAIVQLGRPLDQMAERDEIVDELFRLTDQGDPLLLALWLGQLWERRDTALSLDAKALARLAPSFQGFYALWRQDQEALWQSHRLAVRPEQFEQLMHVLANARGPLMLLDLAAILNELSGPQQSSRWDEWHLSATLDLSHRLVVGDAEQRGYVLVHPRLAQYFQQYLAGTPGKLRVIQAAFRHWGEKTVHALNKGEVPARECSRYLLRHYVTAHLETEGAVTAADLIRYYVPLLQRGWAMAWDIYEGSWQGYLIDLGCVARVLRIHNQAVRTPQDLCLVEELRIALIKASIRSTAYNLPVGLVLALVEEGLWSLARGVRVAMLYEPIRRAEWLAELATTAEKLGERTDAEAIRAQAFVEAQAIPGEADRVRTLVSISAHWKLEAVFLQQVLRAVATLGEEHDRAQLLSALSTHLAGQVVLLQNAFDIAVAIRDEKSRSCAVRAVAKQLRGQSTLLRQVLSSVAGMRERERADTLVIVVEQLQGERNLLQLALQAATEIQNENERAGVLAAVAAQLQGESLLLERTLQMVVALQRDGARADALVAVSACLNGKAELLQTALRSAIAIRHESERANALVALVAQLRGEAAMLQVALQAAKAIQHTISRAQVLVAIAAQVGWQQRSSVLQQAWQSAATIHHEVSRARLLVALSAQLHGEQRRLALRQALETPVATGEDRVRCSALLVVTAHLQGEAALLQRACEAALGLQDEDSRARVLAAAAIHLQAQERQVVLRQAVQIAWTMQDESARAGTIAAIAEELKRVGMFREALDTVAEIQPEDQRCDGLVALAGQLQDEPRLLQEMLQRVVAIGEEGLRARALAGVAERLKGAEDLIQQALQATLALQDQSARIDALMAISVHLKSEQRHAILQQALYGAAAIQDEGARVDSLLALTGQLQGAARRVALQRALQAAMVIPDRRGRANALLAVAKLLDAEQRQDILQQALQAALTVREDNAPFVTLVALATELQGEQRETALRQALALAAGSGVLALLAVAALLEGEQRHAIVQRALEVASGTGSGIYRVRGLLAVAEQLSGEQMNTVLQSALRAAQATDHTPARVEALVAVAVRLEDEERERVLQEALQYVEQAPGEHEQGKENWFETGWPAGGFQDGGQRAHALLGIAAHLGGERRQVVIEQALHMAEALPDESERASVLTAVAAHLQGERRYAILQQALQVAAGISDDRSRAKVFSDLVPQLVGYRTLQQLCLRHAMEMDIAVHVELSMQIAKQSPELLTYELWSKQLSIHDSGPPKSPLDVDELGLPVIRAVTTHTRDLTRATLLDSIAELTRLATQLTGRPTDAEGVVQAIIDVSEWWP